ncbi:DUF4411 family protein [Pseudomonas xanthosomatis]|uniref:DUF4411 family protein n=1 Tax=Pseudomonas xanthosomatis TaxID=2842356 RepID=UPI001C3D5258|nr:DUF4411 family protein [Pseudomonas xanthosomatis]QXH44252.1 DUF4411 family protein [Pseudomonas xanthosomatis]
MAEDRKLYLLDANTLITSQGVYYPQAMVPELWSWLEHQGFAGRVKMPFEIYEEIIAGKDDPLTQWITKPHVKENLILNEQANPALVAKVTFNGYAPDLNENEIAQIGRDPFLISYALGAPLERCVVSLEVSKPSTKRQNRRVPDVCKDVGAQCCDVFGMMRALGFHTGWRKSL